MVCSQKLLIFYPLFESPCISPSVGMSARLYSAMHPTRARTPIREWRRVLDGICTNHDVHMAWALDTISSPLAVSKSARGWVWARDEYIVRLCTPFFWNVTQKQRTEGKRAIGMLARIMRRLVKYYFIIPGWMCTVRMRARSNPRQTNASVHDNRTRAAQAAWASENRRTRIWKNMVNIKTNAT